MCMQIVVMETNSHITKQEYAMIFKSKSKVGMEIPTTTVLNHIGPGSYRGKEIPSCTVHEPDRQHYFFKRDRQFPVRQALTDTHEKIKSFSETHNRGISFAKDGKSSGNVHLQEWTKTKIIKIYPKLGRKKYGASAVGGLPTNNSISTDIDKTDSNMGENSSKGSLW